MDKKDMREKNQELILCALRRLKKSSKPNLAKETGLSVVTVNAHLDALIAKGEVELVEETLSIGGRPARQYRLNSERHLALGAYITPEGAGFKLTTFVVNLFGDVISGSEDLIDTVNLEFLQNSIMPVLTNFPNISYIILGLDGEELKGIFYTPAYASLNGIALKETLSAKMERTVVLTRDIEAAIIGAAKLEGIAVNENVTVGVSWKNDSSHIGIFFNGKPYLGRDGFAGNIGKEINTNNPIENAARALSLTTRVLNPNYVILYNEKLRVNDYDRIKEIVLKDIDEKFFPKVLIRPDIREDYGEGIYTLAASYLQINEAV